MNSTSLCILALLGVAVANGGCQRSTGAAPPPSAPSGGAVERVAAAPPVRKTIVLTTTQPGRIEAFEETPLQSRISGYVGEVLCDIGDRVQSGQALIRLSVPEMRDELSQKRALVAQAEADVNQAAAAVDAARAVVETAEAKVAEAEAGTERAAGSLERWQAEYSRLEELARRGSVTEKLVSETLAQLRSAEASRKETEAGIQSAKAGLNEAQALVRKTQADRTAAEARIQVAAANLAYAQTMLDYAEIKAPFEGVVTQRAVDVGHFVQTGASAVRPLMVVVRTDQVRIFVDVPETEAPLVDVGDPVDVRVQALGGLHCTAAVTRTSWSLQESNRSLRVEADVENPEGRLRPGMYALATILLDERRDALTVPATAIVRPPGQSPVCCIVRDGKIERRDVALGLRSGDDIEVLSGLDPQLPVVSARAEALQDQQPVEVIVPQSR
ncbi:MAG: efflux RND transporter periplasmic adaptor subunit [Planctomyces sp.]|nr:efflux RND transporter periplasmic adaptor subunit [Planctomyces sp.]